MHPFRAGAAALALLIVPYDGPLRAETPVGGKAAGESVEEALCRLIDGAAAKAALPSDIFTRLLWQESSFRSGVTSPAGAQGIAQFMPGTARERGLDDPFDPEKAIPASAGFLADLVAQFGNIGLAAAAYNGGPARVGAWLAGTGHLPFETQSYVERITGRPAEDWAADRMVPARPHPAAAAKPCLAVVADLKASVPALGVIAQAALAPWGVQLSGNFSKALALASFERVHRNLSTVLGDIQPMVIGTRLRTRGFSRFYRVRVPAQSRPEANALCGRIRAARGFCLVLRS